MPCTGDDYGSYQFIALNAPDPAGRRTMAARLNDIINVKDRGAKGDNFTDDTTAIQNAINYAIGPRPDGTTGGIVFFPQGVYKISKPLTCGTTSGTSIGVILRGTGKYGSIFAAAGGGYTDPNNYGYDLTGGTGGTTPPFTQDCIERVEGIGGLSIKGTRDCVAIVNCSGGGISGKIWIDTTAANSAYISDCKALGPNQLPANSTSFGLVRGALPGYIAYAIGSGVVSECRAQFGFEIAYALGGSGSACVGCSVETCGIGVRVGWGVVAGVSAHVPSTGAVVLGLQTERVGSSIDLYDATGCYVAGNILTGTEGLPTESAITGFSWAGGTATATTLQDHNLPAGSSNIQIVGAGPWVPAGNAVGATVALNLTHNTFSYPLPAGAATQTGSWTWNCLSGIRIFTANECVITGNHITTQAENAGLDFTAAASNHNNVCMGNLIDLGILMPTDAHNLASWKFLMTEATAGNNYGGGVINPDAHMVFANLPGQAGVFQPGPFEGQEYDIIDSPTPTLGNFAAAVTVGGGPNHVRVRYSSVGPNWRIIG